MPTRLYKILLELKPAAQLESFGEGLFTVRTTKFTLKEIPHPTFRDIPIGLEMLGEVAANSIEEAWRIVLEQAEGIASIICFLTRVGMPNVELLCGWESTPKMTRGPFIQFYKLPIEPVSSRNLRRVGFEGIADRLESAKRKDRIARAMRWYRKGLNSVDSIDRFTYFWIGLENLNGPFIDRYNIRPEKASCQCGEAYAPCAKCGAESYRQDPRGVRYFISKRTKFNVETYEQMLRLRHDIVHGKESTAHLRQEAGRLAGLAEETIASGVRELLEFDDDVEVPENPISNAIAFTVRFDGIIQGPDLASVDEIFPPHFVINDDQVDLSKNDEGKIVARVKQDLKLMINPSFQLEFVGAGIYGEGGGNSKITARKKQAEKA